MCGINFFFNSLFLIYEFLILVATRTDYYRKANLVYNFLDLTRISLVYVVAISILKDNTDLPIGTEVAMHMISWINFVKLLEVFKPTRYMIQMLQEIIISMRGFLIILGVTMLSYA